MSKNKTVPTPLPSNTLAALDGDELRARIFHDKYALRADPAVSGTENGKVLESTPAEMWQRVAQGVAEMEEPEKRREWEEKFLWLMSEFRFVPGGRILHAIGNLNKVTSSNCYVIPNPHDSIQGIYHTAWELAETFKRGGGAGLDISSLRPKNAPARNAARTSTGAISFMELYSLTAGTIGQQGRRGALIITIADHHPDVLDFCHIKRNLQNVRYANISVRISDEFMRAVERDGEWLLHYENPEDRVEVKQIIRAKELWNGLIQGARDFAEPGCLFWNTIRKFSSSDRYPGMKVVSTNPCLSGSTRILTKKGLIPIAQLNGSEAEIYLDNAQWSNAQFWKTGRKSIYRLTLSNGMEIEATTDHLIDFGYGDIPLKQALGIKTQPLLGNGSWIGTDTTISLEDLVKLGFIHGDGHWHSGGGLYANVGENDNEIREILERDGGTPHGTRHIYFPVEHRLTALAKEMRIAKNHLPERKLPETIWTLPPSHAKVFLKGLFSANGSVINSNTGRVALKTACKKLAQDVQILLCALGYPSYITTNRPRKVNFANGTYKCRESYDLNISGRWARKFKEEISFIQAYKIDKLANLQDGRWFTHRPIKVVKVEKLGEAEVYDFSQPETNHGWANGFRAHNCGEEPLEPYGICCLGSLNLSAFALNPFTPQATIDSTSLEKATRYSTRFLDNILTWNRGHHPLPQQEEAAERGRRIGVGIMGLADMLCKLGLKYDSDEGIEYADRTLEKVKLWAYDESANLAAEKSPFPVFDASRHFNNPFFSSFPPELIEKMARQGLRNVTLLTVPPTGTIAAFAGVTSGIEPIFDLSYTRRSESLSRDEFSVVHPLVEKYRAIHNLSPDALLPDFFTTAHIINSEKRVLMQATVQHHIDQAISSTINLPQDTTVETVEKVYRLTWEAGCKGVTVYRAGSREGILISEKETKKTTTPNIIMEPRIAPRPPILTGVTVREETPLGTAFVTVNHAEQDPQNPFEVFILLGKAGSDLGADAEALGRLISLILRLPSPMSKEKRVREIIGQLEMIGGARAVGWGPSRVRSMPDGIARVLTRYLEAVQNGTAPAPLTLDTPQREAGQSTEEHLLLLPTGGTDFCPRCRQATLIPDEGCLKCTECGFKEC